MARSDQAPIAFNHTYLSRHGGVERYVYNLALRLLARGHRIDFYGWRCRTPIDDPHFRFVHVPMARFPQSLRVLSFAWNSARLLKRAPPPLVVGFTKTWHHHIYRDGSGCRADYVEYLRSRPGVAWRRPFGVLAPLHHVISGIERRRYRRGPTQIVIANSDFVRRQIANRHPPARDRVRVVHSGVDCDVFSPALRSEARKRLSRQLKAPQDAKWLVFLGNDYHRKGLDRLVDALSGVQGGEWLLLVGGRDRREGWFRDKAVSALGRQWVRFCGFLEKPEELLAAADLFCLPTRFDAFPNVVLEALASGTPVLTSRETGGGEIVAHGDNGYVCADVPQVRDSIQDFLSRSDHSTMRELARAEALRHTWERHVDEWEEVFREVTSAGIEPR